MKLFPEPRLRSLSHREEGPRSPDVKCAGEQSERSLLQPSHHIDHTEFNMVAPKITLYVDIVSPFAYIAFHVLKVCAYCPSFHDIILILQNSPTFAKCTVTYVPILLGGLMQATGNNPPINIKSKHAGNIARISARMTPVNIFPDKDKWINLERIRWAKYFSVPLADRVADGFPLRTLGVQRALCAIAQKVPAKMPFVLEALYRSLWVDRNSKIGEPEGFGHVLESVLGKETTRDILAAVS